MILILGTSDDPHASLIYEKLLKQGKEAAYFDTRQFPSTIRLSYHPEKDFPGFLQFGENTRRIELSEIEGVYWRTHMGYETLEAEDAFLKQMAIKEIEAAANSFLRDLPCTWINPLEALELHRTKPHQLRLINAAGIRTPKTLISNDPDEVIAFFEAQQEQVIYKPVFGGAHTCKLTKEDLTPERLQELQKAPVQFQEYIPGTDIRVYLVGEEIFAAEIQSKTLDFRDDPDAPIQNVILPDAIIKDCKTIAKTLKLVFTGIDVRRTPEGEYVFFEGNPSPMFYYFEKQGGYPISDCLVKLLTKA